MSCEAIEFFAAAAQRFHFVCSHEARINLRLYIISGDF